MGQYLSSIYNRLNGYFTTEQHFKIILVGMSGSGKTTILYKLAFDEVVVTQPTMGANCEEVQQGNMRFQIWDLSGAENMRGAWSGYS